jgi:hypothetical protein
MINQILAGILAGSGWLIGYWLYKWTKEELQFTKKINLNQTNILVIAAIFAGALAWKFSEVNSIIIFAGSLLFGSLYGIRSKLKHHILLFGVHILVFLIVFYLTTR